MRRVFILIIIWQFISCENALFENKSSEPEYLFESFWHELDRNYSFFNYNKLSWDSIYATYRPSVNATTTEEELFEVFTTITDLLNDAHTNVYTQKGVTGNIYYFKNFPLNQIVLDESYFKSYNSNNRIFEFGELMNTTIGYIKIKTFDGDKASFENIDSILVSLNSMDGLIIDVRSNSGGKISNTEIVMNRFTDTLRTACKYRMRNGPQHTDFTEWINFNIAPGKANRYNKPVAILTNRRSYSATEWFVLAADILPYVTIVGDTTGGGSAIPLIRELPNGWLIRISNSQTNLPSGRDFQFTGLYPDIPVWINNDDAIKNIDTILEEAILVLNKNKRSKNTYDCIYY